MDVEFLFEAIAQDDQAAVAQALASDAAAVIAARDPHLGSTPLIFAAHRGFGEIVRMLLAAGADVDAREQTSDSTALHWAAESGQVDVIAQLLARGARVDVVDGWWGLTPLGWATVVDWAPGFRSDRPGAIAALRAAGAELDIFTAVALGDTAFVAAADAAALRRRLGHVGDGHTPLHVAADRDAPAMIDALIARGAALEARSDAGLTPLAVAVMGKKEAAAARLRAAGAVEDVSVAVVRDDGDAVIAGARGVTSDERTQLVFACAIGGYADAATALLAAGADLAARQLRLVGEVSRYVTPHDLALAMEHEALAALLVA